MLARGVARDFQIFSISKYFPTNLNFLKVYHR